MLRTLIVDDNIPIQNTLISLLEKNPDYIVIGACSSITEARVLLSTTSCDVVLLDIELEDGNAFDLLRTLPIINFKIIFITAFNEHAIKAIKFGAMDYLLKPVDEEELRLALNKVVNAPRQSGEQIAIAHNYMSVLNGSDRIVLKEQNIIRIVHCKDILYCRSDNGYTTFFLADGRKIMVSGSIKEYEKLLPLSLFFSVHQYYIVNLEHIELYNREGFLILKTGTEVPVSVRKRDEVIKVLTHF
jgi:two-component system, LytTR family, response regulator